MTIIQAISLTLDVYIFYILNIYLGSIQHATNTAQQLQSENFGQILNWQDTPISCPNEQAIECLHGERWLQDIESALDVHVYIHVQ